MYLGNRRTDRTALVKTAVLGEEKLRGTDGSGSLCRKLKL